MVVELRTYRLTPGSASAFVDLMRAEALPLLADHGMTVLGCGLSLDADEEPQPDAYLIRSFASVEERAALEASFYGSRAWIDGPREAVLALIVSFHTVVLEVPDGLAAGG